MALVSDFLVKPHPSVPSPRCGEGKLSEAQRGEVKKLHQSLFRSSVHPYHHEALTLKRDSGLVQTGTCPALLRRDDHARHAVLERNAVEIAEDFINREAAQF